MRNETLNWLSPKSIIDRSELNILYDYYELEMDIFSIHSLSLKPDDGSLSLFDKIKTSFLNNISSTDEFFNKLDLRHSVPSITSHETYDMLGTSSVQGWSRMSPKERGLYLQMYIQELKNKQRDDKMKTFKDDFKEMLPYVDPDSPRFIDWVYAYRMNHNNKTMALMHEAPNSKESITLEDVKELFTFDTERTFVYETNRVFRFIEMDETMTYPQRVMVSVVGTDEMRCVILGDEDIVKEDYKKVKERFLVPKSIDVQMMLGFRGSDEIMKTVTIAEDDNEQYFGNDDFYPKIKEKYGSIDNLVKGYSESKSNVLLLIGPPGTGKSTFLRTLMFKIKTNEYVSCNNELVLKDQGFNTWIQNLDDGTLLLIEDADTLCHSRKSGNESMSALLNLADGVVKRDIKIVISTNLPSLSQVDPALIRPGRSFDVIEFPELEPQEAQEARSSVGLEEVQITEKMTLSEALHIGSSNQAKIPKIGF